jgi:hypothetical protein
MASPAPILKGMQGAAGKSLRAPLESEYISLAHCGAQRRFLICLDRLKEPTLKPWLSAALDYIRSWIEFQVRVAVAGLHHGDRPSRQARQLTYEAWRRPQQLAKKRSF